MYIYVYIYMYTYIAKPYTLHQGNPMLHSEFEHTSLLSDLKGEIIEMRGAIDTIENSMLMPMPFQYYHMGTTHARKFQGVNLFRPPQEAVLTCENYCLEETLTFGNPFLGLWRGLNLLSVPFDSQSGRILPDSGNFGHNL